MTFTNEGTWDRAIRVLAGLSLFYVAWLTWPGAAAVTSLVIGCIALMTGLTGWCLLYKVFHISTKKRSV